MKRYSPRKEGHHLYGSIVCAPIASGCPAAVSFLDFVPKATSKPPHSMAHEANTAYRYTLV